MENLLKEIDDLIKIVHEEIIEDVMKMKIYTPTINGGLK